MFQLGTAETHQTSLSFSPIDTQQGDLAKKNIHLHFPQAQMKHLFLQLSFISTFLKITPPKGQRENTSFLGSGEEP